MYTQCPECGSVYRITSAHLRQAAGEVQCGRCEARFDALDRLSDVFPRSADGPAPRMPLLGETPPGDAAAEQTESPPEDQRPEEETPEEEAPEEETPEEEAPEEETPEEETPEEEAPEDEAKEQEGPKGGAPDSESAQEKLSETEASESESAGGGGRYDDEPTINLDQTAEQLFAIEDLSDQTLPDLARMEFAEGLPLESDAAEPDEGEDEPPPEELTSRRTGGVVRWALRALIGAALLGLVAYGIHLQSGVLMRNPALAPWLDTVYGWLGERPQTTWDVGRLRILDSSAEVDDSGDLQVRLSFMNEGDFAQPYPDLRIVLEDRWGDEIGRRQLPASEYLSGYVDGRRFSPGERATGRATVEEPGLAAVGFRLDLCLPRGPGPAVDCLSEQPSGQP